MYVTALLVPLGFVTLTDTGPATPAGAVAVMDVSLLTVKLLAGVEPKLTAVTPVKCVPVRFTTVPPVTGPEVGVKVVIVGAVSLKVNGTALLVPRVVVTVTPTVPAACGGVTAKIFVSLSTVIEAAGVLPKLTDVPEKPEPVMVTTVPPAVVPLVGVMLVITGGVRPAVAMIAMIPSMRMPSMSTIQKACVVLHFNLFHLLENNYRVARTNENPGIPGRKAGYVEGFRLCVGL